MADSRTHGTKERNQINEILSSIKATNDVDYNKVQLGQILMAYDIFVKPTKNKDTVLHNQLVDHINERLQDYLSQSAFVNIRTDIEKTMTELSKRSTISTQNTVVDQKAPDNKTPPPGKKNLAETRLEQLDQLVKEYNAAHKGGSHGMFQHSETKKKRDEIVAVVAHINKAADASPKVLTMLNEALKSESHKNTMDMLKKLGCKVESWGAEQSKTPSPPK